MPRVWSARLRRIVGKRYSQYNPLCYDILISDHVIVPRAACWSPGGGSSSSSAEFYVPYAASSPTVSLAPPIPLPPDVFLSPPSPVLPVPVPVGVTDDVLPLLVHPSPSPIAVPSSVPLSPFTVPVVVVPVRRPARGLIPKVIKSMIA